MLPPREGEWVAPVRVLLMALATVAASVLLADSYAFTEGFFSPPWLAAAWVHSVLAALVVVFYWRRGAWPAVISVSTVDSQAWPWLRLAPWKMYLPAAVVLGGAAVLSLLSRGYGGGPIGGETAGSVPVPWAWVFWVPLVEELVFRYGIGALMHRFSGSSLWAAWFSALTFALVHTAPTLHNVSQGHFGIAAGPFLLGLLCEVLAIGTGRLAPLVALHAACTATVIIFSLGDQRWLDWLRVLYN